MGDRLLIDAVADMAIDTLEQYKILMFQSRFDEANQCLNLVDRLTSQTQHMEDHTQIMLGDTPALNQAAKELRFIN
jgi:hypothetical protein